jgi:hypothetical protein
VPDTPAVFGQGSIPNDQNWTPLLNDAFIIGGAHARHEFHLAEDSFDQYLRFVNARAFVDCSKDPSADAAVLWQGYFTALPRKAADEQRAQGAGARTDGTAGYRPRFARHSFHLFAKKRDAHWTRPLRAISMPCGRPASTA